jgi:rare lipoprotein A
MRLALATILLAGLLAAGCAATGARPGSEGPRVQTGVASYYGGRHDGRRTASGEVFDQDALTAAHRDLPMGTRVRVTNLENQRSVVLTINDRGPFVKGRIIDVSRRAARELGLIRAGTARVRVEVVER